MSIKRYLKDHGVCILIFLICMGITEGIFLLFNLSITLQIFVLIVLFLGIFAAGIYDYKRKKSFYQELEQKLQKLEEKYLLMEMLEKPEFLEGQIFYDVLLEMQKSMSDEIFIQIRKNNEFKRYIETWVHEVKLPIASIRLILHEYKGTSARTLKEQVGRIEGYVEQVLYYLRSEVPEVKLPIASIRLILHEYKGTSARTLKEQVGRIEGYVEQVLYYLRSEVPEKDYRIAPHSLKKLTNQCISENRDSLILNKIKIVQETQDISVYTDEPEKDYRIAPHSLKKLTNQCISENRDSLILNKIKIVQETQDISVYTDEKWMRFILGQIISNAVKYKKEDSIIRIWSHQDGKHSFLHILDNGMGIAKEDLPRVFEKSFTGKNGRIQQASTGMGLYLCNTLCKRLGHRLAVQSKEGEYTEITIEFYDIEFYENEYLDVLK